MDRSPTQEPTVSLQSKQEEEKKPRVTRCLGPQSGLHLNLSCLFLINPQQENKQKKNLAQDR